MLWCAMLTILSLACTHTGADYATTMQTCNRGNQPRKSADARRFVAACMFAQGASKNAIARTLGVRRSAVQYMIEIHESLMVVDRAYAQRYRAFLLEAIAATA